MTIVITLKSDLPEFVRGNAKSRRRALRAAKFAESQADLSLARDISSAATKCSVTTLKAISLPAMKEAEQTGSICIPDVAMYQAGHRKIRDGVTHIVR